MTEMAHDCRGDPYTTLGVDSTASTEQIHSAFRQAIRSLHPDHHAGAPADHVALTDLVDAWHLLGDPARRADLDRTRRSTDRFLWQPAEPDLDHKPAVRTALLAQLFLVTAIATVALLTVLFVIAMSQSG